MTITQTRRTNNDSALVDPAEIAATLSVLHPAGSTFEIRGIGIQERGSDWTNTLAGYFSDPEAAARAVAAVNYVRGAFYVTLQTVKPEIISRCADRLHQQRGKGDDLTKDKDVIAYQWIPLDCDTERSTGIMASEAERHAAEVMAAEIAYDLEREGWGRPILADSGSGRHLDYKTKLPMFAKGENPIQELLEALQHHYGTEAAKIDRSVFNPARVWRWYGTWNRKGDDDAKRGRPHRRSCILERPDEFVTITRPMIDHIIAKYKPTATTTVDMASNAASTSNGKSWSVDDVSRWLDTYLRPAGISIAEPTSKGATTQWELTPCPMTNDHGAGYAAAVSRDTNGVLGFKCFGERCSSYGWKDLRAKYEIGAYDKQSAAVDLRGIMGQVTSGPQATSDEHIDDDETPPEPIKDCPEALLTIPGFVAELVDYTLAVAPYPNRVLAFAGAISLLALLTGRKVRDESNMRTNVMLLALAGSASGKDYPRKVNAEILKQIGIRECLGDAFASGQGLEDALFANPAMLFQTDEFDTLMQSVAKSRDGTQEATVSALLKFYTSANSTFPMRRKAGQPASYIENPHLCVFGTAIPEMFYASLTERMLTNGLLARMIVLEAGPRGRGQDAKSTEIPESILQVARDWAGFNPGLGNLSSLNPTPLKIASTDDARRLKRDVREAAEDEYSAAEKRHDVAAMTVWGRAPEQVAKLAMLFACSETNPLTSDPVIGKEACEWAREFAFHQVRRMLAMVRGHVAETEFDRECLKTLRRLQQRATEGMEHWKALKASRLKARDFRDVVQTLHERQQIHTKIEGNRGPVYFPK